MSPKSSLSLPNLNPHLLSPSHNLSRNLSLSQSPSLSLRLQLLHPPLHLHLLHLPNPLQLRLRPLLLNHPLLSHLPLLLPLLLLPLPLPLPPALLFARLGQILLLPVVKSGVQTLQKPRVLARLLLLLQLLLLPRLTLLHLATLVSPRVNTRHTLQHSMSLPLSVSSR